MQMVWFMTMLVFTVAFFLVFFAVYFFRPKKDDKIIPLTSERELLDPEEISLSHRAEPNWPATIETEAEGTAKASIISVTHGSAFITGTTKLAIGEKFQITIDLPDRPPLQLKAEVTWSNMHLPAEKVLNRGMGIRFIEAGEDAVCLINDTINQHAAALKAAESLAKG
jgi:Tfp pilus assembly protein PilZ